MWAIHPILHKCCPGGMPEGCDLKQMGKKNESPSCPKETHLECVVAWLGGARKCWTVAVTILLLFQDFALLRGGIVEVIQTQPLIFLLHYPPDCGCLLSSVWGWKAVSIRNHFHCKIQKTQLIWYKSIYDLVHWRCRWWFQHFVH